MDLPKALGTVVSRGSKRVARDVCSLLRPHVRRGDRLLDLGCGSAVVGKALVNTFGVDLLGADVEDARIESIPFVRIDGRRLPFAERTFDDVLISYVLHHTSDADAILREAARVAKRHLYILEDTPATALDRLLCHVHGMGFRVVFGLRDTYQFRSAKQWIACFSRQAWAVTEVIDIPGTNPFYNPNRTAFVVRVSALCATPEN